MSKSRQQGTAFESWIVNEYNSKSPDGWAERIAEGGEHDRGDIRIVNELDEEWIIEAKATERLNVTRVLNKARKKSRIMNTVLIWKRLVKNGTQRRGPDGEKIVVVMDLDTFWRLINHHPDD